MNNKTLAAISYVTLIGWIVAYMQYKNSEEKSPLVRYHLEQALGLAIASVVLSIAIVIITSIAPSIGVILSLVGFVPLIFAVLGVIAALNEVSKPLPVIGGMFTNKFAFLN